MQIGEQDTIAAIATPQGEGAISVIRVSGPESFVVVEKLFRGDARLSDVRGYTVHLGKILSSDQVIDQVLATVFKSPNSYTGEDTVEISCHGGFFVTRRILEVLIANGARQAEPGEFTKRAFLNGKLDLSQAEAVADLISSRSSKAHLASVVQLQGRLGEMLRSLRKNITDLCSLLELELDFSEEGVLLADRLDLVKRIETTKSQVSQLIESYRSGRIAREGFSVCLIGKPNVGKSSLFNSLLASDRSIVTPVAGTTRDLIEESISLDGFLFILTDTAGMRETSDIVESEGVSRTNRALDNSDAICYVVDSTDSESKVAIQSHIGHVNGKPAICVHNKIDLLGIEPFMEKRGGVRHIFASAASGSGIEIVRRGLVDLLLEQVGDSADNIQITNIRHLNSLEKATSSLSRVSALVSDGISGEFLAFELREAADSIGAITGEVTSDEILNNIFSRFCIGK